jgi:hypothetical protein
MNNPEEMIRRLSKYIDWEPSTCHFFYIAEQLENVSKEDQKESFKYFIDYHVGNAKTEELSELHDKFKKLSYEEKISYFSEDTINIIDCRGVDNSNIHTYLSLYDLNKNQKKVFIYYASKENLQNYLMDTENYRLKTATLEESDKEIYGFQQYNKLKEEIEKKNIEKNEKTVKKPKI